MSFVDPAQFYGGFDISYDTRSITPILQENTSGKLLDLWDVAFAGFSKVNVCLSGGIDSQFVLSMLSKLKKDITVYIFSFVWEDCIFNAPDVLHAIRYCERYNFSYKNIEIDYKSFINGIEFIDYCRQYKATSPQIALQLKMLDYIDNTNPIFLGGDIPVLSYDFSSGTSDLEGIVYQPFMTYAFLNYARINNRLIIKELLRMNPATHALSYREFINTTKKHNIVIPSNHEGSGSSHQFRVLFYQDLGANLITPLLKNTGFEMLKMHLAKKTGVYNQYDLKYRYPLHQLLAGEEWYKVWNSKKQFKLTVPPLLREMQEEFEEFCRTTTNLKLLELYNFNL